MNAALLQSSTDREAGFSLLEGLIAILVFSLGIMAILALQISSISAVRDAKFRSDAGLLANQIIGQMWADSSNLSSYALNATATSCALGANSSTTTNVTSWLTDLTATLPGANNLQQKIVIGNNNLVVVTVCWKSPQDNSPHQFSVTAQIQ